MPLKLCMAFLLCTIKLCVGVELIYSGTYKGHPVEISYSFNNNNGLQQITSSLISSRFKEKNVTVLQNNSLIQMEQITDNAIDNEYFYWTATKDHMDYSIYFKNNKFLEEFTATLDGKHMPMSLQGFIFMIQEKKLAVNKTLKINILTPWKTIIPIKFRVLKEVPYPIENEVINSYYIELELDSLLSYILPKTKIWVTKSSPHYLLKQTDTKGTYMLKELP